MWDYLQKKLKLYQRVLIYCCFQEFEGNTQPFDVYQLEQLVMLLKNPFSSVNVVAQNGIVIGFVCPEVSRSQLSCFDQGWIV